MLLDLYQHSAKCATEHMSVSASRTKASKLANTPLEDNSISLHLFLLQTTSFKTTFHPQPSLLPLPFPSSLSPRALLRDANEKQF